MASAPESAWDRELGPVASGELAAAAPAPAAVGRADEAMGTVETVLDPAPWGRTSDSKALEALTAGYVEPLTQHLQPWRVFATLRVPEPGVDWPEHIQGNLRHFQSNYLLLIAVFFVLMFISHPRRLIFAILVLAAWGAFLHFRGLDPDWRPQVCGVELHAVHRAALMTIVSVGGLFAVAGEALVSVVGVSVLLTMLHAALHPGASWREVNGAGAEGGSARPPPASSSAGCEEGRPLGSEEGPGPRRDYLDGAL